jgi:hypothetical protein
VGRPLRASTDDKDSEPDDRRVRRTSRNEHYCLQLARALGLTVPDSRVQRFEDEIAMVVDRYDRIRARISSREICVEAIPETGVHSVNGRFRSHGTLNHRA